MNKRKHTRWTENEIEILIKEYPLGGYNRVAKLVNHSIRSIRYVADKFGIKMKSEVRTAIYSDIGKKSLNTGGCGSNNRNWKGGVSKNKYTYKLKSIAKYPEKHKARTIFQSALRSGKIIRKPCSICGNTKSEAHHDDYSKPLEVIWLCKKHHDEQHIKLKTKNYNYSI